MHRVETFSTAGYARADRIAYWNDVAASIIGPLVIEAVDHDSFDASMKRVCLRNCEILAPTSNPASIRTEPTGAESGILNLQIQHRGRSSTHFSDRVSTLEAGDFMLFDPSCASLLEFSEATQAIVVRLPVAEAERHVPGLRELAGIPIRGNGGGGALLSGFVRMAWSQLEGEEDLGWADSFCEVIWPLVEMAYSGVRSGRPATPRGPGPYRCAPAGGESDGAPDCRGPGHQCPQRPDHLRRHGHDPVGVHPVQAAGSCGSPAGPSAA